MIDFKKRLIRILIISFVIILVLGGLFYYFRSDILKKVEQINIYRKELASRESMLTRIRELEQQQVLSLAYTDQLKSALPTETEMVRYEEVLQNLASQNNLNLSFRFGALNSAKDNEPQSYSFNLVLSGEETYIPKWLEAFQNLDYISRLEQIELNQTRKEGNNVFYDVKVLGRVYIR
jgi:Tfp pilus assembly protein PilO